MSGEALYERYKDALKRGHVASLRGRLEEALTAYAEAATIAPERSTPHTSAATALLRRKRPADALRHYEAALRLSPRDEAALLGRAQALALLERRPEAADAFDALAENRATGGKLADAVDAARRGLELAEGRERRRTLERLIERLRASEPGEPGRLALERALRVLEGPAVAQRAAAAAPPVVEAPAIVDDPVEPRAFEPEPVTPAVTTEPVADVQPVDEPEQVADDEAAPSPEPDDAPQAEAAPEAPAAPEDDVAFEAAPDAIAEPESEPVAGDVEAPVAEAEPVVAADVVAEAEPAELTERAPDGPPVRAALDRDLPAGLDPVVLGRSIEEGIARGATPTLDSLLDLAAALRRDGRTDGALDACYVALSYAPDDVGLHLALVELYDERGWAPLATEKLALLERLVALDNDPDAARRVAAARAGRE